MPDFVIRRGGTMSVLDLPADQLWMLEDQITIRQLVELAGMREALKEPIQGDRAVCAFFPYKTHECLLVRAPGDHGDWLSLIGVPWSEGQEAIAAIFAAAMDELGPAIAESVREVPVAQN